MKKYIFYFTIFSLLFSFSTFAQNLKQCANVRKLTLGGYNTIVLFDDGTAYGFGETSKLPFIDPNWYIPLPRQIIVDNNPNLFLQNIFNAYRYGLTIVNGEAWFWGENVGGGQGCLSCSGYPPDSLRFNRPIKIKVDPTGSPGGSMPAISHIGGGVRHSVLLAGVNGELWVSGESVLGQLGTGNTNSVTNGYRYVGSGFTNIKSNYTTTIGFKGENIHIWGEKLLSTRGGNTLGIDELDANTVPAYGRGIYGTIGGEWQNEVSAVIRNDGSLWTKGFGARGGLGRVTGTLVSNMSLAWGQVGSDSDWKDVSSILWGPVLHALKTNGELYTWGAGPASAGLGSTEVSNGTVVNTAPVRIAPHIKFDMIVDGMPGQHFGAVSKNKIFMWGHGGYYQLGTGNVTTTGTPTWVNKPADIRASIDSTEKVCNRYILDLSFDENLSWGEVNCDCSDIFAMEDVFQIKVGYKEAHESSLTFSNFVNVPATSERVELTVKGNLVSVTRDNTKRGRFFIDVVKQGDYNFSIKTVDSDASSGNIGTTNKDLIFSVSSSIE